MTTSESKSLCEKCTLLGLHPKPSTLCTRCLQKSALQNIKEALARSERILNKSLTPHEGMRIAVADLRQAIARLGGRNG